jgi:exopolysaccharide biosynthesis polyprenyl glycosylphosphotransferase
MSAAERALESAALYEHLSSAADERTIAILDRRRRTATIRRRGWLMRRMLLLADVLGLMLAFAAAQGVFLAMPLANDTIAFSYEAALFAATLPIWILVAKLYGLYDRDEERTDHSTTDDVVGVFHLVTVGAWIFFVGAWLTGLVYPDKTKLVAFWALAIGFVTVGRAAARGICRNRITYWQNTVIVGAGDIGQLVARKVLQHPEYGLNIVGFIDDRPKERRGDLGHISVVGIPEQLPNLVRALDVERVIIAFSNDSHEHTIELVRSLKDLDVQVDIVPRLFELVGPRVDIHTVEGLPLVGLAPARLSRSSQALKRAVDIVGASLALLLTAPLFALIAWRIRHDSPGPVFFRQTRLGMNRREFTVLKFRTMRTETTSEAHEAYVRATMTANALPESNGLYKLERHDAITPFGRWLRRTSLDELPQFLNVLRGDMSLVGPRPCLAYETEYFQPHHFQRFAVPAGLTGLWQVTARAHSTFGEALDMDVSYALGWSFGLDLRLLARTPLQLLVRRGTR